jgi:FkbM family methyltransferase
MFKDVVRAMARSVGVEIHRYNPARSQSAQLKAMLGHHGVNLIFDVGANVGQFGSELRKHIGYRGRIVSFEPTREAHAALVRRAMSDADWTVAERLALGATEGSIDVNISANSVSSSVLSMLEAHAAAAPESEYTSVETVRLTTLDSVAPAYLSEDSVSFLKIDTQGYEAEVLEGASATLSRSVGLQLELSLKPLYGGQLLWSEMLERITAAGFELWAMVPVFADGRTGRLLQIDATFFRSRSLRP